MAASAHSDPEAFEIRSFRVVFAIERRLFKLERWRLPVPHGVPLRALAYFGVALVALIFLDALPLLGSVIELLPAPLRFVGLPALTAATLARVRVDGRPAHHFLVAWARHRAGPRHLHGFRAVPRPGVRIRLDEPIVLVPGLAGPHLRPGVLKGPAVVGLRVPVRTTQRGPMLALTEVPGAALRRPKRVTLAPGQRLVVRDEAGSP
jgi:hypothetical protein